MGGEGVSTRKDLCGKKQILSFMSFSPSKIAFMTISGCDGTPKKICDLKIFFFWWECGSYFGVHSFSQIFS